MKLEGRVEIRAPRPKVWAFVTDPDHMAGCGPGVQSVEKLDGSRFRAHARVGLGFISAAVVIDAEFTEIHEPDDATVLARGHAPGSAVEATLKIVLTDGVDGSTAIDWTADVEVSGLIASAGAQQMEGIASKMLGQTLDCVKAKLEA